MTFAQFKTQYHLNLNPQQEEAVQALSGPVLLLAVPGSGKTTVLVSRIGYLIAQGVPPENILTMTYTVSAARDMSRRFAAFFGQPLADRLEFRTINGVCSRIIRAYERTQGRQAFQLLEDIGRQAAIIGEICRRQSGEFASESTVKAVQTAITYVKNSMISGEDLEQVEVEGVEFPPIYQEYCRLLRTHQLMDYDDQMIYAHRILKQFPQLLEQFRRRYPYLCVDEAQDTSKIQHAILRLLAGQNGNLFLVGDEDQSIYGFRAAYPQALTQFESIYPGAKVLYLEQNYRSTRPIVAAAQKFIEQNKNRRPKHMKAVRGEGPALKEIWVQDRSAQYRYLAQVAQDCKEETAILYRDNDSALPLIDLLERQGIPYRCRQVDSGFFTHWVVRDIVDILTLAQDPWDGDASCGSTTSWGQGSAGRQPNRRRPSAVRIPLPFWNWLPRSPVHPPGPAASARPSRPIWPTCSPSGLTGACTASSTLWDTVTIWSSGAWIRAKRRFWRLWEPMSPLPAACWSGWRYCGSWYGLDRLRMTVLLSCPPSTPARVWSTNGSF